jgi:single-strand DNA-binding protein
MKTMNKTQLIGYLGNDPEIKEFPTGAMLARFSVATHTKIKNPTKDGPPLFRTTWHTVKIWGREKIEKIINQFVKGSHVLVEGQLKYRTYKSNQGETRHVAEIKAFNILNLDR